VFGTVKAASPSGMSSAAPSIVVIGASTGGTRVVAELLGLLPPLQASLIIVQHMPQYINNSVVRSWGQVAHNEVKLAEDGEQLAEGLVLVAPSKIHCAVTGNCRISLKEGPEVNFVRPSIDVTMRSLGRPTRGQRLIGVVLTGMGQDGAAGLAHIKELGGRTIVQNEATCAIYGMPGAAVRLGAVDYELPPEAIARLLTATFG
jgi:two-component system, chemotaxis family, protein-glutamate methylesterase/glutaminase